MYKSTTDHTKGQIKEIFFSVHNNTFSSDLHLLVKKNKEIK